MNPYQKPARWFEPKNKIFPYQVGFTSPPHDFDAAPTDFLEIAPKGVGAHGRMIHVPDYDHSLAQRVDNFQLLEEFVECMANNGADVCAQVGSNWVHAGGKKPEDIRDFCKRVSDKYETPLHMAGYALVEALREIGAEKIALNGVYHWPDWWQGKARYLRDAGFDVVWAGNFVDQGFFATQEESNDCNWVFPHAMAAQSMQYVAEQAPQADAIVVNGMCNFRRADTGLTERIVSLEVDLEAQIGKPIVASDTALYWRVFKSLRLAPKTPQGKLLSSLQVTDDE
ncbi:MAG: hypothetical protein AAF434_19065 [Pseudomonadota bacterium]